MAESRCGAPCLFLTGSAGNLPHERGIGTVVRPFPIPPSPRDWPDQGAVAFGRPRQLWLAAGVKMTDLLIEFATWCKERRTIFKQQLEMLEAG
jgi:hypothetical protein